MLMRCNIPVQNIKVFARGIHSLAKIGEDLYFEPQHDGLALRTVNSSRSAFASFLFCSNFFSVYECLLEDTDNIDDFRCKITMKSAVWVFRSISNLDKTVKNVNIAINDEENQIKIVFQCKHDVTKKYSVNFLECETLKAKHKPGVASNHLTASAKTLNDAALNFMSNQEEVTLMISETQFQLKNFVNSDDMENDRKSIVHSILTMQKAEFGVFETESPSTVTFCLKELRALIGFAEAFNLDITMDFEQGGEPIVFTLNWSQTCKVALVMATLNEEQEVGYLEDTGRTMESSMAPKCAPKRSTQRSDVPMSSQVDSPNLTPIFRGEPDPDVINMTLQPMSDLCVQSPPSKKARYIFQKCFNATIDPAQVRREEIVWAPDSDEENM